MQAVKSLKICTFMKELCPVTPKNDAKFEEKITLCSKNGMGNLVSFNASSGKLENLHFDVLFLLKLLVGQ